MGKLEQPVNTNSVLDFILEELDRDIRESGVQVVVEPLPEVRIPESSLIQLFENLIGNALRYAGPDAGPIEIGGSREGQNISFYVVDHGKGIPKKEQTHIFTAFYRGTTSKGKTGSGVGLATVQKICKLYGGSATIAETPGGGTTFQLELLEDT
jgi:signal transduction histidine kinase